MPAATILAMVFSLCAVCTGLIMVVGRERFARNASQVGDLARHYSTPRGVALWGAAAISVGLAVLAFLLLMPGTIDRDESGTGDSDPVPSVIVLTLLGVALLLAAISAFMFQRTWRAPRDWPRDDEDRLRAPRGMAAASFVAAGALGLAITSATLLLI